MDSGNHRYFEDSERRITNLSLPQGSKMLPLKQHLQRKAKVVQVLEHVLCTENVLGSFCSTIKTIKNILHFVMQVIFY